MNTLLQKIDGLYDIQPPAVAEPGNVEWLLVILFASILLFIFCFMLWKIVFTKKNRMKRNIRKLHKTYKAGIETPRETVFLLSGFVRRGLGLKCLTQQTSLPLKTRSQHNRWSGFTGKIDLYRYSDATISTDDLDYLFSESIFWLRNWP